jgi:hypothetical protein
VARALVARVLVARVLMDRPMLASLVAKSIWKMRAKPELPGTYKPYLSPCKANYFFSFFSFLISKELHRRNMVIFNE